MNNHQCCCMMLGKEQAEDHRVKGGGMASWVLMITQGCYAEVKAHQFLTRWTTGQFAGKMD